MGRIDRERAFNPEDYPQQAHKYVPTIHFGQRAKEPERYLSDEKIRETIEGGSVSDNGDGLACFRRDYSGVAYYILAGFHRQGYRILVTGWPVVHRRAEALDSGRWSSDELRVISKFNERESNDWRDTWADYIEWSRSHPNGGATAPVIA